MKQPKQKSPASARKIAKTELKARLLTTLKTILDQDKIKLTKKIKKRSGKLVKAIANELVIAKPATAKAVKAPKAAAKTKAVAPATNSAVSSRSTKKTAAKTTAAAVKPTEKVTVKTEPVKANTAKPVAAKTKAEKK